jgi:ABC-type cobalamin/Fe3+-siderophores transport system ATPase subunit
MSDLIRFENVMLGYRRKPVLENLNFAIGENEFFGIVGANGSGKTTILRALLGILKPMTGAVVGRVPAGEGTAGLAEGGYVDLHQTRGALRFGYVPQRGFLDELYPLSARDIVLMGRYPLLGFLQRPGERDHQLAREKLEQVGIGHLADKAYRELSGGQKQRVLIARALAAESHLLVLDEPTDGMDLEGQYGILELIAQLRNATGISIVYVTHRLNELANHADRLLLLHAGTVRVGAAAELLTGPVLSAMYGINVQVEQIGAKRVVLA